MWQRHHNKCEDILTDTEAARRCVLILSEYMSECFWFWLLFVGRVSLAGLVSGVIDGAWAIRVSQQGKLMVDGRPAGHGCVGRRMMSKEGS